MQAPSTSGNPAYFDQHVRPLLGGSVYYIGTLDDEEKQRTGAGAHSPVPDRWPKPFGLVIIEAMACGIPLIAYHRGSVDEAVRSGVNGFAVEGEEEAVTAAGRICDLNRNTVRAEFEQCFSASRMADGYEAIYRKLLES